MEVLELKLALAKEKLESAKKDVDNIYLQIELYKKNFCENNTTNHYEIFDTNIEIFDTNIGSGDDYFTFPSTASISDVVKKCIEIGSYIFVTKPGCQFYIRSPPTKKCNREYETLKKNALDRVSKNIKCKQGYKTYLINF